MAAGFDLFGRLGVEGASVRMIADAAGVNVAAIGYHFGGKRQLFWAIMVQTFRFVDRTLAELAADADSVEDLAQKTFNYFFKERLSLKNTMALLMAEGMGEPPTEEARAVIDNPMGPPGGEHFAAVVARNLTYTPSQEGLQWAVKTIFGAITHWALVCSSCQVGLGAKAHDAMMSPEQVRSDIMNLVAATMAWMESNQQQFSSKLPAPAAKRSKKKIKGR